MERETGLEPATSSLGNCAYIENPDDVFQARLADLDLSDFSGEVDWLAGRQ